jgi:hypothetical protein
VRVIGGRLMMTGEIPPESGDQQEPVEVSGFDNLLFALGDALRTKQSKEAIAALIKTYADGFRPPRGRLAWLTIGGWILTLLVIASTGVFGVFQLISKEPTAALVGIVIGSLFRRGSGA